MKKYLKIKIYGKVQGVFFRHSTIKKAQSLNICGFVKNEADGSVYIEAEGENKKIKNFLQWCYEGPQTAKITKVNFFFNTKLKNFKEFTIKY